MSKYASAATVTAIGLTCKTVLNLGLCTMTVRGLPKLMNALESSSRDKGRGVVTVSNHISTLDDPLTWGILPMKTYWNPRMTRWVLGASDIMFTNPILSTFFRYGQVLETFRGRGIYQPAVDSIIEKLNQGEWLHLFSEGYIRQIDPSSPDYIAGQLRRFKWGIGRMIMETSQPPLIIPMWLTGFESLMPEGRRFPFNFLPRFGAQLSVTFGDPVPQESILSALRRGPGEHFTTHRAKGPSTVGEDEVTRNTRIAVTDVIQKAVEALGKRVISDMQSDIQKDHRP